MRATLLCIATVLALHACAIVPKPTAQEYFALDHPPESVQSQVDALLPKTLSWLEAVARDLSPRGRALTHEESQQALALGVKDPARVRVLVLDDFPMPADPSLLAQAKRYGLGSSTEGGRSMGYLILLKPRVASLPTVLRHELVHVAQRDRMGLEPYLRRYLTELEMMGYARSPLELEAYAQQARTD